MIVLGCYTGVLMAFLIVIAIVSCKFMAVLYCAWYYAVQLCAGMAVFAFPNPVIMLAVHALLHAAIVL